jgi:3',5'-cyclic AMP phosphodiesterase CpdA
VKIAYITDTHLGATAEDWSQQPRWVGGMPALMRRLRLWLDEHDVEIVVHGGDVVHAATFGQIQLATALMGALGRPVFVSLGNHDLTERDSYQQWQSLAGQQRWLTAQDTHLELDACDLIVLTNQWVTSEGVGMYWPLATRPYHEAISREQLDWLDAALATHATRPAVVAIHAPIDPLPPALTGLDSLYKIPDAGYAAAMHTVLDRHRRARLVLSGHNHVSFAQRQGGRVDLTTSSVGETPLQVRLIEVTGGVIQVTTHTLGEPPTGLVIDGARGWTAGRREDRTMKIAPD